MVIPSILLSKDDGDNFLSVMENTQETIQISMSFHFLEESYVARMMFLLQVDNYDSYQLVSNFEKYIELLKNNMKFSVHYKVFKNTPLDSSGYVNTESPESTKGVVYIERNYYFVVKNDSFEKSEPLFFETLRQICLYYVSDNHYFQYMRQIANKCFSGPDPRGNMNPVSDFTGCTHEIYETQIHNPNPKIHQVEVTKGYGHL